MAIAANSVRRTPFRHSPWDGLLVAAALLHGLVLALWPNPALIAVGVWWNSNTVAHNFIHKPFFVRRWVNVLFGWYQGVLLGVPQTLWRQRHLAHHADVPWRLEVTRALVVECALIAAWWALLAVAWPRFFFLAYLPAYAAGLVLCQLQGHFEHAGGGTVSHYGRLYNALFFNDGYHVEHHRYAGVHWRDLPAVRQPGEASRYPAVLRWVERSHPLHLLERLVLRSRRMQRWVLRAHHAAIGRLLAGETVRSIGVVGGGLFPRSAIVLKGLCPDAEVTVIDGDERHIEVARLLVDGVRFEHRWHGAGADEPFELLVIPLSYRGDRDEVYRRPRQLTLVHDWIWRRRGDGGAIVSCWMLKRINLVRP